MNKFIKNIALVSLLLAFCLNSFSGVQAIYSHKQFWMPKKGAYIENYLSFVSSSLKYKSPNNDLLQAKLLVTQMIKQGDVVIDYKKYEVLGPILVDSIAVDFKDQKRFFLAPGDYEIEIIIKDLNNADPGHTVNREKIKIKEFKKDLCVSEVELIDYLKKTETKNEFSKSGYDIFPMVSNYLPTEVDKLAFYVELYNFKKPRKVLVKQYIETYYGNKLLSKYLRRSVKEVNQVVPILNAFDIKTLPSGNYNLVIEIRDSLNKLITLEKVFIQRVNGNMYETQATSIESEDSKHSFFLDTDSLDFYLESLSPIANRMEYKLVTGSKKGLTKEQKERYFYNFWQNRYGVNAVQEWDKYRKLVYKVDNLFGTRVKRGYETDMGRVYIKYGKPNDVINKQNEQGTYPYSIWHYYQTNGRSNVMFVFYQSTMAYEDFELIHSDMQGEITNSNWKILINNRVGGNDSRVDEDENRMK